MSLEVHLHVTGAFAENTYVAIDEATRQAVVVDPGEGALAIWRHYAESAQLQGILLTHAHLDHIFGLSELHGETGAPIYLHDDDLFLVERFVEIARDWGFEVAPAPMPENSWKQGDTYTLGETEFRVLHTPGHSPGSVSLYWGEGVFTGDALMSGSIGRTDFPRSDAAQLLESIRTQLYSLPDDTEMYAGHMGPSTIGHEKRTNPFVRGN